MTNTQETVNSILIDVLKGVKDAGSEMYATSKVGLAKAVDFAIEQAPLVVQEFLSWKMGEAIFNVVLYTIATIVLFCVVRFLFKKIRSTDMNRNLEEVILFAFGFMFSLVVFCFIVFLQLKPNIETIIKIKLAPRVYILEYVTKK
jgi:type III secretion system FlhB-like substrate exporter